LTARNLALGGQAENLRMSEPRPSRFWPRPLHELPRSGWLRLLALALFIPAFYALWAGEGLLEHLAIASWLSAAALLLAAARTEHQARQKWFDTVLAVFACVTVLLPDVHQWPGWLPRLAVATALAVRVVLDARVFLRRDRLWMLLVAAAACWALGGVGFYWLDPRVHSVADGLWLAFTTGATVGYGDLIPTVGTSRVLALFVVLVGYTFLSLVTAAMVTALLGREERMQMHALHRDIAALHAEIKALRQSLQSSGAAPQPPDTHARTHAPAPALPPAGP
jgi:voltage-gated potassium channel